MITVVVGPPCAGKSTYVKTHAAPDDIVVDFNRLTVAFGATSLHDPPEPIKAVSRMARAAAVNTVLSGIADADAWIIHSAPKPTWLLRYRAADAKFVTLDPGETVCLDRAGSDKRPEWTDAAIRRWYANPPVLPPKSRGRGMLTKNTTARKVKAGPEDGLAEGEFLVYPSTFTKEPDSVGDVVAPGAFLKSLEEWKASGNVMPGLFGHRMDDPDYYVAAASDFGEDEHGWWVKGSFDLESPKGKQVYRLVKGRRLNQLSFSYDVVDEAEVQVAEGVKANELRELKVYEFSFVPVGANQDTGVVAVKAIIENVEQELKAGRVLSAKNEGELRKAHDAIGRVLVALDGTSQDEGKANANGQKFNPHHGEHGRFAIGDRVSHVAVPDSPGTVTRHAGREHVEVTWDPEHGEPADTELIHEGDLRPHHPKDEGKASGAGPSRHTPPKASVSRGANQSRPSVDTSLLSLEMGLSA